MKKILFVIAIGFTLISCGGGSSDGNSENENSMDNSSLEPVRNIATLEDFTTSIVGKTLVLRGGDGIRDPNTQAVVNLNMKVLGFDQNGDFDLDWYWDNGAYCRSGVSSLPDNPQTIEIECQNVDIDEIEDVVNFLRNRGNGGVASSWFIE